MYVLFCLGCLNSFSLNLKFIFQFFVAIPMVIFVCLLVVVFFFRMWNVTLYFSVKGILFNWTLILHGTTLNPLEYNPHVPSTVSPQTTENTVKNTPTLSQTGTFCIASFVVHFLLNNFNSRGQNCIKEAPLSIILPHFYV